MAVGKEILTKIRSVQNTQKITKAMQMVSTSKNAEDSRPDALSASRTPKKCVQL